MKVRNIWNKSIFADYCDIDVYDDYDERTAVAFCTPAPKLTGAGEERFAVALDCDCEITGGCFGGNILLVHCDTGKQAQNVADLFYSLAGYCSDADYHTFFID